MQRQTWDRSILTGGEDNQEPFGGEIGRRNEPRLLVCGIIGESPAGEVHPGGTRVVKLDPVWKLVILVGQRLLVVGHELADDHLGRSGEGENQQVTHAKNVQEV